VNEVKIVLSTEGTENTEKAEKRKEKGKEKGKEKSSSCSPLF